MPYSQIHILRKQGRINEATALASDVYDRMPGKMEAIALFWCLHDKAKTEESNKLPILVDNMKMLMQRHDPDNEVLSKAISYTQRLLTPEGQSEKEGWELLKNIQELPLKDIKERKVLLMKYLTLSNTRPSRLHTQILLEAIKMGQEDRGKSFLFSKFMELWGLENLSSNDWNNFTSKDGHKFPSNVEKIISCYVKEMHTHGTMPDWEFRELLKQSIEFFPQNYSLQRYSAQILAKDGKKEEAIASYKKLIQKQGDKFYLWDDLSDLIDDPELKIASLCAAITSGAYEEFLVNIRLHLADLLCNKQMYRHAATELEIYANVHERNRWPLRQRYFKVAQRIPQGTVMNNNNDFYAFYKSKAQDFIYEDAPSILLVKTWEKKDMFNGKTEFSWQLRSKEETYWIKPRKFKLDLHIANGTPFEAKVIDDQIVRLNMINCPEETEWLKNVTGSIKIPNQNGSKKFGFVEGIFVPSHLLYSLQGGEIVTVRAILNNNEKWSAISLVTG